MKKLFALALGLILVVSAVIFLPEASNTKYHTYLKKKVLENRSLRRVSDRNYGINPYRSNRTGSIDINNNPPVRNFRYSSSGKRVPSSRQSVFRPISNNRGKKAPSYFFSNKKFITKPIVALKNNWTNFSTQDYVLTVPEESIIKVQENTISFEAEKSTIVSITKIIKKDTCFNMNFLGCARGIIAGKNTSEEKLVGRSNQNIIHQKHGHEYAFSDLREKTEYYVQSGIFFSRKGYLFISQKVVKGINGEFFLIDISSKKEDAHYTIPFVKRIFDTFHIFSK